ncbi:MAG TPA: cysteine desulfurase family protein [Thermotogota bacterium]|nr:cysteine desulfurase family protein [Thermotogota bacterium]HRW93095.1 cysteine desulfurase family protein [Thermotogota bacterium]
MIYMDHYRTTPVSPEVKRAMEPFWSEQFYLPVSFTRMGTDTAEVLDNAKARVLTSLGLSQGEVIFTGGGTAANNLVIHGLMRDADLSQSSLVSTQIDHPSITTPLEFYRKKGAKVSLLKVDGEGLLDPDRLKENLSPQTRLVALTWVNHTIGSVQDISSLVKMIREVDDKIPVLLDATMGVNSMDIDMRDLGVDYLTFSAHKIYGPKGMGAIVAPRKGGLKPTLFGAVSESVFWPGGENIPGIVGLSVALEQAQQRTDKYSNHTLTIREALMKALEREIPDIVLNGPRGEKRVSDNVNYSFRFIEGESVMMFLDFENIVVATGSACASSDLKVNYILSAIGRDHEMAHGSLRITPGWSNSLDEVEPLVETLKPIVERLRAQSTIKK